MGKVLQLCGIHSWWKQLKVSASAEKNYETRDREEIELLSTQVGQRERERERERNFIYYKVIKF